jgi:hypothetical protein
MSDLKQLTNLLPPGSYLLDCAPFGPPKLLSQDPSKLTPEQRIRICNGTSTFSLHPEFEINSLPNGSYKITPK